MAVNSVNGKGYIGKTLTSLAERKVAHESKARLGSDTYFHRAIRKHGPDAFDWEILDDDISEADLSSREINLIAFHDTFRTGYNSTTGGESGSMSDAVKTKLSEKAQGRVISEETRRKIGDAHRGRKRPPRSAEHSRKISEAKAGVKIGPHSEETKDKIRKAHLGRKRGPMSAEHRKKISDSLTGVPKPAGHGENVSKGLMGHKLSDITKSKISEAQKRVQQEQLAKGIHRNQVNNPMKDPEVRKKVSDTHKALNAKKRYESQVSAGQQFLFKEGNE